MRALARLLTLAVLFDTGCSTREHANPFDPANPVTGGRPADFVALAGDGRVTLQWRAIDAPGLLGYRLFRSLTPDTGFAAASDVLPPATHQILDIGLLNGADHFYRLHYVFDRGLGPLYAADAATPGPLRPWVTDDAGPVLDQLTADGRHIAQRVAGAVRDAAGDVDVDRATGQVWTCDPVAGDVTIYGPLTGLLTHVVPGVSSPVAVAVDPLDHSAWVGDDGAGEVHHYLPDGTPAEPSTIAPVAGPFGLAVDPVNHSLWMCERRGDRVRHSAQDGTPLATAYIIAPSRVAVDPATRDVWVTSFSRGKIYHLSALGAARDSFTLVTDPLNLAVDPGRGRVWVTDPVAGQVVVLDRSGAIAFVVPRLPGANDVALDLEHGEAWVTVQDAQAVARISAAGAVLRQLGGFGAPNGIALDPGKGAIATPQARPQAGDRPTR